MFFSGSIRCPKCRADMEQVRFEGTTVDRCRQCSGLWFDAGEFRDIAELTASDFFKRWFAARRK